MKKSYLVIFVSLMVFGLLSACAPFSASSRSENLRSMTVNGIGRVTLVPDIATINIGVRTEEDNVTDALNGNTSQANAIADVLQDLGVEEKDIQTSNFNVYPSDRYNPMTGEIEGQYFVVENTVNVTVRDLSNLGEVLTAVVEAGANNIYGINFIFEAPVKASKNGDPLALEDAKAKAEIIAGDAGVELGDLISINVYEGSTPITYLDSKGGAYAAAEVPIAAGTLSITMECNLTYEIE